MDRSRLWNAEAKGYQYVLQPDLTADLDALMKDLRASEEDRRALETAARLLGSMKAVEDSGWVRTRRIMWAYASGGA